MEARESFLLILAFIQQCSSLRIASGVRVYSIYTAAMALKGILAQIDLEIARLQQARALLASTGITGKR